MGAQELAEGDQAWNADETQSSTSSSDSIPSLESFHYDTNNQPSFSPMPSTSTSNGNSTKGKNNLKTQQKNAIYIRNLKPSIAYNEWKIHWTIPYQRHSSCSIKSTICFKPRNKQRKSKQKVTQKTIENINTTKVGVNY